jgi:hypothetical protein
LAALAAWFCACGAADEAPVGNAANREPTQNPLAIHACSLVTRSEAEAVLGPVLSDPEEQNSSEKSTCSYVGTKGVATVMVEYPRSEHVTTSAEFAAKLAADVKKNSADPEFAKTFGPIQVQPVEGLGIPAAWHDLGPRTDGQVWLDAIKNKPGGGQYLRVMSRSLEVAKVMAATAVTRLP